MWRVKDTGKEHRTKIGARLGMHLHRVKRYSEEIGPIAYIALVMAPFDAVDSYLDFRLERVTSLPTATSSST